MYVSLQNKKRKASQSKKEKEKDSTADRGPVIYLNVIILNKEEVVKREVEKKLKGPMKVFRGAGTHLANKAFTNTKFSEKIGGALSENIPAKLEEKANIKAKCECVYTEDALCVLALQILADDINLRAFVEHKVSERALNFIDHAMDILGVLGAKEASEEFLKESLCDKIQQKLQSDLPQDLEKKLGEKKGVKVKVVALPEELQASWFFGQLKFMAEARKQEKANRSQRGILPPNPFSRPKSDEREEEIPKKRGFFPFSKSARS
eukprot:CAMPEP_0170179900 /NCGR_PEP_ID=MMETSP0040_2-20121228/19751_1 /TAXON_ID=641309 /ORGANISM="Lotharella oceanica, Strain CCMP622" /LENGTH=263 /DNA_ID=CAMNT_0010424275 /DNA_START=138 /DNA_END=929 /DNA_ORIENTATION=-